MSRATSRLCLLLALLQACFATGARAAEPSGRDVRALVPAGRAAHWKNVTVRFDQEGRPSYFVQRRGRTQGQLESVGVSATPKAPEIPKTIAADALNTARVPVDLSRSVFVPALNRKVRYYLAEPGGGSENDTYRTEPVACPDGRGGTLHVVIQAEAVHTPPAELLASVRWMPAGALRGLKEK